MAGHVVERSPGRWRLRVQVGTDPISGRQRYVTRTVAATSKRAAERLLATFVAALDTGEPVAGEATFGQVLDEWMELKADRWSPATVREHRRIVAGYLEPLHKVPVHQLRTIDLDRFYKQLRTSGGKDDKPLDPATVRRIHVVVRAALQQAIRWELILRNPATVADPGSPDEPEVIPPTVGELGRLLAAAEADSPELAGLMVVAAVTGARRGAMCALRWTDVDLERGVIRSPG